MTTNNNLKNIQPEIKTLNYEGNQELINNKTLYISIEGARKCSPYGIQATEHIIDSLKGYENIAIVAGSSYGIEGLVHTMAIKNNIPTICTPISGINDDVFYPKAHLELKHEIIQNQGLIMSEFSNDTRASLWTAPIRNRLIAGLAHIVIMIELEERSDSQLIANIAIDTNKKVIVVPSNIFSRNNGGNYILKNHKEAIVFTDTNDLMEEIYKTAQENDLKIINNNK